MYLGSKRTATSVADKYYKTPQRSRNALIKGVLGGVRRL